MTVTLPIRLVSEANQREHWAKKARRVKSQRGVVRLALLRPMREFDGERAVVTITRIAPRALDGHDNLRASAKACVDGIADAFGCKDNDERIEWKYAQARGGAREYAVRIQIERTAT